ncbi:MAG: hypothetical protein HZB62_03755 [Nitrospirae bacterium]|nr:hypothetical protein [Nitrospirota bacterium]
MIIKHFMATMICVLMLTPGCTWGIGLPTAKITIMIIDEGGQLIEGAKVGIGFERNTGGGTKEIPVVGFSAKNGEFTGSASAMDFVGFRVEKEDYYQSFGNYRFKDNKLGKWQPWNPEIKVVMRKIENPVPMYAQDLILSHPNIVLPVVGKPVGFDLIEYDWVSPYGNGKHSDFIFNLEMRYVSGYDYDANLTITFPNKFDGIQVIKDNRKGGSVFKLPRHASEEGYQNKLTRYIKSKGPGLLESDFKDDNNYIFRVRSEVKDGKLIKAMYGKIQGDISFFPTNKPKNTARLEFKYFLNPDYTRNLEYGKNLFPGVQVRID